MRDHLVGWHWWCLTTAVFPLDWLRWDLLLLPVDFFIFPIVRRLGYLLLVPNPWDSLSLFSSLSCHRVLIWRLRMNSLSFIHWGRISPFVLTFVWRKQRLLYASNVVKEIYPTNSMSSSFSKKSSCLHHSYVITHSTGSIEHTNDRLSITHGQIFIITNSSNFQFETSIMN